MVVWLLLKVRYYYTDGHFLLFVSFDYLDFGENVNHNVHKGKPQGHEENKSEHRISYNNKLKSHRDLNPIAHNRLLRFARNDDCIEGLGIHYKPKSVLESSLRATFGEAISPG